MGFKYNPFTSNFDAVDEGGSFWLDPIADKATLDTITTDTDGSIRITLNTNDAYRWNSSAIAWQYVGKVKAGSFGSSPNSNGFSVGSDNTVTLQPADSTHPGSISTTTQSIAGIKTFSGLIKADGGVDVTATGGTDSLNIGTANSDVINIGSSGATVNIQGTTLFQNVTNLQVADKLITVNKGGSSGSGVSSGVEIEENSLITGYSKTSGDRNSWVLKAPNTAGDATITPGSGITIDQSSHNPVTLAAVGSSPNANGASLSTQQLTLQPADGTNPGLITAGTQTIGGAKTFNSTIAASNLSNTNTGDVTIGTANGLSLASQALSLQASDASHTGALTSTDWSTFNNKQPAGNYITALTSDVSASGPGSASATVNSVGGSSSANIHTAELAANAATDVNTVSTIVKRDGSGNFTAGTITAALTGTASGNVVKSAGDIAETSFSPANNQAVAANITGLTFANGTVRAFDVLLSIYVNATSPLYECYKLSGIQKGSSWNMSQTSVGDDSLFVFTITNAGQIQYTNSNYSGFVSATIKFRALTTSV